MTFQSYNTTSEYFLSYYVAIAMAILKISYFHIVKIYGFSQWQCLSNRINVLKSHIYMSSFHIYVQITIYMSKLQYIDISKL